MPRILAAAATLQSKAALLALLPLAVIAAYVTARNAEMNTQAVTIAVEHTTPLELSFVLSTGLESRLMEISHDAKETILLSLPQNWERGEVRNVPLTEIIADAPEFGFIRWHLPPGSDVSFRAYDSVSPLVLHNPSGIPVLIHLTLVDLNRNTTEQTAILMKDLPVTIP